MAHELSLRPDGKAEMAFVGETPWHGLGQSLTKGASIGVWTKEAGFDWQAESGRVSYHNGSTMVSTSSYKMLYRSDTKAELAVVGNNYNVVQPRDVLEFFREMVEQDGWYLHTAGVLREGRKLWAMASNGDRESVGKGDEVVRNVLLATSLDGSMRTVAKETTVRVVCANTLAMALAKGDGVVATSHRSVFDKVAVHKALGLQTDHWRRFIRKAQELAETPVSMAQANDLLRAIFRSDQAKKSDLAWLNSNASQSADSTAAVTALALFSGRGLGADLKTAKGTAWGLLNAVTEHVDHDLGRTRDTRLDSAWFGRGDAIKRKAVELIGELV